MRVTQKVWRIDFNAFIKAIVPKEYLPQSGIVRIRSIDNAWKEYNKKHNKQATIVDVEACIFSGKVFAYINSGKTIVNYDELETELEEYLKKVRKDSCSLRKTIVPPFSYAKTNEKLR